MLDWVGDVATSQGAEVTGPRLPMSRRQKPRFLLLGLRFLAALLATRVPPNASTPPPPRQEPLNLNHVRVSVSQSFPGPAVVTAAFRFKSGLVGLGETLSYFGLIRSIQTSGPGPPVSLAWTSRARLLSEFWPYLSPGLAWLPLGRNPFFPS